MSIENNLNNDQSFTFDETRLSAKTRIVTSDGTSSIVRFLINKGLVKNNNQAMIIILLIIIAAFVLSGLLIFKSTSVPNAYSSVKNTTNNVNQ